MSLTLTSLPIYKVSATGNDFLLIDLLEPSFSQAWQQGFASAKRSELVSRWCDRQEALGADGMVILETDPQLDFKWDFYNSDGGNAEMCGNAARAVCLYVNKKYGKSNIRFNTRAGEVSAVVRSSEDIEVTLPAVKEAQLDQFGDDLAFDFVRPGVPHAVVKVEIASGPLTQLRGTALKIKSLPQFQKAGVNVTFVRPIAEGKAESVTFERGVEGFTRACGTGAIAAAYSLLRGEENREYEIQVPGGRLSVILKNGRPHLRGPAKLVAEIHFVEN